MGNKIEGGGAIDLELKEVDILRLQPGDMLVIRAPMRLSDYAKKRIGEAIRKEFPEHKVLVLEEGLSLEVLRE